MTPARCERCGGAWLRDRIDGDLACLTCGNIYVSAEQRASALDAAGVSVRTNWDAPDGRRVRDAHGRDVAKLREARRRYNEHRGPLSPRQAEVRALRRQGLSYRAISDRLGISLTTVHTHDAIGRKREAPA